MKKLISALLILTMIVSMVCVSTSAAGTYYINYNFDSMETFTSMFTAGQFFVEDPGTLHGYAEAKALQSAYETDPETDLFLPTGYTWLTYDASITLSVQDDNLSESSRYINLSYCNDNMFLEGREEGRVYMAFMYDVQERCFRLAPGHNNSTPEEQYLPPVYMEVNTDGEEEFTMGISVEKGRMRCFYNDTLIFDLVDSANDYLIAHQVHSCFLFWQDGNYVQIKNISVADQGTMFPNGIEPPVTTEGDNPEPPVTTEGDNPEPPVSSSDLVGSDKPIEGEGSDNKGDDPTPENSTKVTTTATSVVDVTDEGGNLVTDDKGEKVTSISIITEATTPGAATNTNKPVGGSSTATGDATFVVVAAMVATLGCALIVRKVSVK